VQFDPSLLLLVVMVVLLVLVFRRGSRQRREVADLQAGLAPGAQIMTSSGLYATVVAMDGDSVTLETAPGQRSRWDRRAVVRVLPADAASTPLTFDGPAPGGRVSEDEPGGAAPGSTPRSSTDTDETTPPGSA
jgi:preprotein translocase subunit YajC